ncbi:TraM recognition domain-containing protein [Spiroplasma endosymbiont of Dasysyrphus albostriatus]|uniref:TraM recognition domain-containing protein n=1 Tax=Spiroplasma endosymbiont of Dasysyrphus albostriatus TaxID=3066299 RepID=UPI0030CD9F5B
MSLFDFSEPHYQAVAHRYILLLINSLMENNIQITLENIINYFSLSKLGTIIDINNQENLELFSSFKLNDIKGLYYRLSVYNEQLKKSIGIENNLTKIVKNHKVILFSLNSLSYPELASNIGKLLVQDLKEFASIKPQNQNINLLLDEFNVFASDSIINLINKTRSFNYQCFLCFQVTDDLSTDKKKLLNTIFGNVGNIIAHKVSDVESPEYIAKVFGTRTVEKITKQYDIKNKKSSKGSIREVEEYIVHPNDLKRLKTGQAYCKLLLTNANQFIKKIEIKNYEKEK